MTGRSPARLLAPLALVTSFIALIVVVTSGGSETERVVRPSGETRTAGGSSSSAQKRTNRPRERRTYVVQAGDTPSSIAVDAGIPLDRLLELNPDVDPQLLSPGQRLKLR